MRSRIRRHIASLLGTRSLVDPSAKLLFAEEEGGARRARIPPEFTPHEFAILLLHIAAGVEHALMVEYLYAGFSLGGMQVPAEYRTEVSQWQEIILGIAKEEMGHLMTVQNLLRCLGGPLNLDREDYPWDSELYPFPFQLAPLTRHSLAEYVYVESPAKWTGTEADEIRAVAQQGVGSAPLHRVGTLYHLIQTLFEDHDALHDAAFRASTYPFQANWDEWGRGYQSGARGNTTGGMRGTPDVILMPVSCRTDALAALKAVATQGEANLLADDGAPSHFARFLRIFRQFPKDEVWSPSRKVPVNPIAITGITEEYDTKTAWIGTPITHPEGQLWGHLFNLRYQILLTNLLHTFEYPSNLSETSPATPRGLLLHATFGEMYNLRALSEILVQTPLAADAPELMAGPPFQMPYCLNLPLDWTDRWPLHLDLLQASDTLVARLLLLNPSDERTTYLLMLQKVDHETKGMIETILRSYPTSASAKRLPLT